MAAQISSVLTRLQAGPVMVTLAVGADGGVFRGYKEGILGLDGRGINNITYQDHVVTLVGFGMETITHPEKTETITTGGETTTSTEMVYTECKPPKRGSCKGNGYELKPNGMCCRFEEEVTTTTTTGGSTTTEVVTPAWDEDVYYWKIQNSWGYWNGDNGFWRILVTDGVGVVGMNRDFEWIEAATA